MAISLLGKTALVTGAAKRLGRAIALALADEGCNLIIHYYQSADEAEEVVREIKAKGVNAWAIKADLSKSDEAESLISSSLKESGKLDFLINSASIFPKSTIDTANFEDLIQNIQINAWVPFILARNLANSSNSGQIINILDTRVWGYDWQHVGYQASKNMLALFTKMMAVKLAPSFTVNALSPGLILPPAGKDESNMQQLKDSVPLKKTGSPEEITDAILFLLKSSFITGQVIFVDGGRHLNEVFSG